ncbi:rho GDP-dissociation inhibitor 1-like [Andrographis paniculata]|uniref:rho GDP-dissociation inhibitor 1-like n=1 Tax=Andrographis paniculata TaxID=175694 RepID=UPI0021E88388|nr:rho GDP-dissociation inhibitor 1-like [Andrographis paniculata]
MSSDIGTVSSSKNFMGLDENKELLEAPAPAAVAVQETPAKKPGPEIGESESCEDEDGEAMIQLGPQCTLKELSEKDKDDESLRRWKEQLLGSVDVNAVGESIDPEVKILSLAIKAHGRDDIVLPISEPRKGKAPWFTLKEGSRYKLIFTFQVSNNIVSGLKYKNTVWKAGIRVDNTKEMIGTFSPQADSYSHEMQEETTPSGILARGSYSARTQFVDDDNRRYLELNYTFEIKKDW